MPSQTIYSGYIYADFKSPCTIDSINYTLVNSTPTSVILGNNSSYNSNTGAKLTLTTPVSVATNNIFFIDIYTKDGNNLLDGSGSLVQLLYVPNYWQSNSKSGFKTQANLTTYNYDNFALGSFIIDGITWPSVDFIINPPYITQPIKPSDNSRIPDPNRKETPITISDWLSDATVGGHLAFSGAGVSSTLKGIEASDGNIYNLTLSITNNQNKLDNPFFNGNLLNNYPGVNSTTFYNNDVSIAYFEVTAELT